MRILFFSQTLPSSGSRPGTRHSGAWIDALVRSIKNQPAVTVAIAFLSKDRHEPYCEEGVFFYPLHQKNTLLARVDRFWNFTKTDAAIVEACECVIADFKPDVIQVFGIAESSFGLLCGRTKIPVAIHIQGLLAPCLNAWVPPFYTLWNYTVANGKTVKSIVLTWRAWKYNQHLARRERHVLRSCRYLLGRTHWDKAYSRLYAPQSTYFHCGEMLRDIFYTASERKTEAPVTFVSTLSNPLYKGHDLILKTANALKETGVADFTWKVYGVTQMSMAERKTCIRAADVNVRCMGVATPEQIKDALLSCTAYVHPSYIDNSPNSVGEAQMVGAPVVATNVGGVSSMVQHDDTGFLVPANDPFAMASTLLRLVHDPMLRDRISENAKQCAIRRHDRHAIVDGLLETYRTIFS